jgi:hypothetical protein
VQWAGPLDHANFDSTNISISENSLPLDFFFPNILILPLNKKFGTLFFELFLVQIQQNFEKHFPKFVFKTKKKVWKTRSELFVKGKSGNIVGEKESWGEKRIFHPYHYSSNSSK